MQAVFYRSLICMIWDGAAGTASCCMRSSVVLGGNGWNSSESGRAAGSALLIQSVCKTSAELRSLIWCFQICPFTRAYTKAFIISVSLYSPSHTHTLFELFGYTVKVCSLEGFLKLANASPDGSDWEERTDRKFWEEETSGNTLSNIHSVFSASERAHTRAWCLHNSLFLNNSARQHKTSPTTGGGVLKETNTAGRSKG